MGSSGAGKWLEEALVELCKSMETGLDLDREIISGLVSYCELAHPLDAKEYLDNIIGEETGKSVIEEYLRQRGHSDASGSTAASQTSNYHAYVKPAADTVSDSGMKRSFKAPKDVTNSSHQVEPKSKTGSSSQDGRIPVEPSVPSQRGNQGNSKKKKGGRVVSLAEAAKGSIVFQQGKPCSCQARRHRLVSNCLSCGKIVCEQEGEGPCSFCGVLVLKEGSTYAGLEENLVPLSEADAAAEAYAKRLVEYDRNSAARTTVIDDQSDYYEIEGNSWLSKEEKELLRKKKEEIEEAERAKRNRVVVTFDLVGRKVLVNQDESSELESKNSMLRPLDDREREVNRIKPNPNIKIQPVFVDPGPNKKPVKSKQTSKNFPSGLRLEITGRVQHDNNELKYFTFPNQVDSAPNGNSWQAPSINSRGMHAQDAIECSSE